MIFPSALPLAEIFLESLHYLPWTAVGTGVLLVLIVWVYPAQLRAVNWPWRWVLPLLRGSAILVLAASVLKPVAVRPATRDERGPLAIVVDRSRSMATVDNTRTPTQLVTLVDALGKIAPGARVNAGLGIAAELAQLQRHFADVRSAQDDLDFAMISGRDIGIRQDQLNKSAEVYKQSALALAAAGAATDDADLRDSLVQLTAFPPLDAAEQWKLQVPRQFSRASDALLRFRNRYDQHLYESQPEVRQACDAISHLSRDQLVQQLLLSPGSGVVSQLHGKMRVVGYAVSSGITPQPLEDNGVPSSGFVGEPSGIASALLRGVSSVAQQAKPRAILLLSDGRLVGDNFNNVAELATLGIPIVTVAVASPQPPRDVSFERVDVPAGGVVGDSLAVHAVLRQNGFDGTSATVHLAAGDSPEQVRTIVFHGGQPAAAEFSVELNPKEIGPLQLTLTITGPVGEASVENNKVVRWVKVMPQRLRIAVWAPDSARDAANLVSLLSQRGDVDLTKAFLTAAEPKLLMTPEQILGEDVIVICNIRPTALSRLQWDAVDRLASERGGSVILVVGDHLPAEYSRQSFTSQLLPYKPPLDTPFRVWPGNAPEFHIVPASAVDQSGPAFQLNNSPWKHWQPQAPISRFLQLPGMGEHKLRPGARALLVEADSGAPVLVEQALGIGRTFLLCTDETWRWQSKVGEKQQNPFWLDLIHYSAQEPYFATSSRLSLDADQISVTPGTPIHIRAKVRDRGEGITSGQSQSISVMRDGALYRVVRLQAVPPTGSGQFGTTLNLPVGQYTITLTDRGDSVGVPVRVEENDEAELSDLSGDDAVLQRIAEVSGGEFFRIENVQHLAERLSAIGDRRTEWVDQTLWDNPYLFALIIGLLGAEWAIRKHSGLA